MIRRTARRPARAGLVAAMLLLSTAVGASGVVAPASFVLSPSPIATKASLTSGTVRTVTVTAKDGSGNPIPGATIYLDFFPTDAGGGTAGTAAVGATAVTGSAAAFVADGAGNVTVTYTAGDATTGADLLRAKDAASNPAAQSNDSYCYDPGDMQIKPSPLDTDNTMLAGAVSGGTITVVDASATPVPGAHVWLAVAGIGASFPSIFLDPQGSGKAKSSGAAWTALSKTPQEYVADANGQVPFFYRTPTLLPGSKTDAIVSQDKASRGCIRTSHYDFGALPAGTRTDRLAGQDRYNTAAAISKTYQAYGTSDTVFIATGLNYPDALAGAAVAGMMGAPVLLVGSSLPVTTTSELARLKPAHIVILGGTGVVSSAMSSQLGAYGAVARYGGANRYDTARLIAQHYFPSGADTVFIATGLNYPDALAGAAIAGHLSSPILLVDGKSSLPSPTVAALNSLNPNHIVILGGTGVVPTWTATQLAAWAPVQRYAGADRYATAAAIANHFYPSGTSVAMVATGLNFPDALTGAAAAGMLAAPILLVKLSSVPTAGWTSLRDIVNPHSIVVLGGTGVIADSVKAQLGTLTP